MATYVKYYGKYACTIHLNETDHNTLDAEHPGAEITHIYRDKFDVNFTGPSGNFVEFAALMKQILNEMADMKENLRMEV